MSAILRSFLSSSLNNRALWKPYISLWSPGSHARQVLIMKIKKFKVSMQMYGLCVCACSLLTRAAVTRKLSTDRPRSWFSLSPSCFPLPSTIDIKRFCLVCLMTERATNTSWIRAHWYYTGRLIIIVLPLWTSLRSRKIFELIAGSLNVTFPLGSLIRSKQMTESHFNVIQFRIDFNLISRCLEEIPWNEIYLRTILTRVSSNKGIVGNGDIVTGHPV